MKFTIITFLSFVLIQECQKKDAKTTVRSSVNDLSIKSNLLTQDESIEVGFGINAKNCYRLEIANNSNVNLYIPCYKKSNGRIDYNPSRIRYFKNNEEGSQFAPSGIPNIFWVQVPLNKKVEVYSVLMYANEADSVQISFDYLRDTLNLLKVSSASLGIKMNH
jgi:hypothetical protein